MDLAAAHERARRRGVNPFVYTIVRAVFVPFFRIYFRLTRIGREHVPDEGPVIFAANHRSFLDPFVIGTMAKRPVYYVSKKELFRNRLHAWFLNSLGAFPVDRGASDKEMLTTAKAILARGEPLVIFPEGTRIRPGALGQPKRGVGRLALETGAPVVPVAVIGTEAVRRGWRIRPHRVKVRAGRPLTFPKVDKPSPQLAARVTDRIWPCVMLQWEWLGGIPPLRRAAVLGSDPRSLAVANLLHRAGIEVEVGVRGAGASIAPDALPDEIAVRPAGDVRLDVQDLVCFGGSAEELPGVVAARAGQVQPRAGVLVVANGFVPPMRVPAVEYVAERVRARGVACLGGPLDIGDPLRDGSSLVIGCRDKGLARELEQVLRDAKVDALRSHDVEGVELAACATRVATVAAAAAAPSGASVAGAAAGKVFTEVAALAQAEGSDAPSLVGVAGTGELVARLLDDGLAEAGSPAHLEHRDALRTVVDLAEVMNDRGVDAPAVRGLAEVVNGQADAAAWVRTVTEPVGKRAQRAA